MIMEEVEGFVHVGLRLSSEGSKVQPSITWPRPYSVSPLAWASPEDITDLQLGGPELYAPYFEGKSIRMMGASEVEVDEIIQSAKADLRIVGFDEEEKRIRQRMLDRPHSSLKLPQGTYIFCDFRTLQLPGIVLNPPPSEALKRMHMLAADPGIVAIMNKHRWRVGIMTEMALVGYVGVSPKCILGFNKDVIAIDATQGECWVAGSSEKSKAKIVQQQYQISSSQVANHTLHGAPSRSDVPRTSSLGKLHVLKPARERNGEKNGVSPTAKDSSSPTSGKAGNNTFVVQSSAAGSASLKSPSNNSDLASDERKPVTALLTVERRPTSQAQSRNDFFNSMRKKSSTNTPALPDPLPAMSTASDNSDELIPEVAFAPVTPHVGDTSTLVTSVEECSANNRGDLACSEDTCDGSLGGDKNSINDAIFYPDEEEAAFLRSLGWEEHSGEDEGLTEEEISAFYKEYMKVGSSSKILQGMQLKIPVSINSNSGSSGGASS